MESTVAVTVVTGFLGAGKTTLLNRWLAEYPRGRVAVVVNEFGAVGVDGELLAARAREVVELTGGCVCCATQAELVAALGALCDARPAYARIVVETSGLASPAGVIRALTHGALAGRARMDGVVTVVDAARPERLAASDLAAEQVGYADVVVLTRADAVTREALDDALAAVAACNAFAVRACAARGVLTEPAGATLEALLALRDADLEVPTRLRRPGAVAHDAGITSVALALAGDVDEERFGDWVETQLARFAGRLLRIKGVLAVAGLDERMILQGVGDQVEVTFGAPWATGVRACRVVLVGFGLDRAELEATFAECADTAG